MTSIKTRQKAAYRQNGNGHYPLGNSIGLSGLADLTSLQRRLEKRERNIQREERRRQRKELGREFTEAAYSKLVAQRIQEELEAHYDELTEKLGNVWDAFKRKKGPTYHLAGFSLGGYGEEIYFVMKKDGKNTIGNGMTLAYNWDAQQIGKYKPVEK